MYNFKSVHTELHEGLELESGLGTKFTKSCIGYKIYKIVYTQFRN